MKKKKPNIVKVTNVEVKHKFADKAKYRKQVRLSRAILEFSFKKRSTVPTLPRHLSDPIHITFQDKTLSRHLSGTFQAPSRDLQAHS